MTILFTGKSDFKYNRVRVLHEGLKKTKGVEVLLFPITNRKNFDRAAFAEMEARADVIYIPPFRHRDVAFIKKIATKPVIFDPLISKYMTRVVDYGQWWKAPMKYFLDKKPFSICDRLLVDTEVHGEYFAKKFKLLPEKISTLPVGVDTADFFPKRVKKTDEKFRVGFYGTFVPLQGAGKIAEAAYLLRNEKDIVFELIGDGRGAEAVTKRIKKYNLKNINFLGWAKYEEMNDLLNGFDICLGIFGDSLKADLVVPNKIYHYAAVGKAIITKDSPGIREVFSGKENIVLSDNSPEDLAEKILFLKNNPAKREAIAQSGFKLISKNYNETAIAEVFLEIAREYI